MKFTSESRAKQYLINLGYVESRGEFIGRQDVRTVVKLSKGFWGISGAMIPSK